MSRPLLLDLCCCQGGASRGYVDVGFDVIGVDIDRQPRYPYTFIRGDALKLLADKGFTRQFAAVHASFPCQHYLEGTLATVKPTLDLVTPGRVLLNATGLPWVMENVMRSPLDRKRSITLCANTFGLIDWMTGNGLSQAIPPAYTHWVGKQLMEVL